MADSVQIKKMNRLQAPARGHEDNVNKRADAGHEHRSIANMAEVLIRNRCGRNGIAIPGQAARFDEDRAAPAIERARRGGRTP